MRHGFVGRQPALTLGPRSLDLATLPLVAVATVGMWFGSRPARQAVKAWQARRAADGSCTPDRVRRLPARTTLVLAELRSGKGLAALNADEHIDLAQTAMLPPQRAVYAAALWVASRNAKARSSLSAVPAEVLLPERARVQPIQEANDRPIV